MIKTSDFSLYYSALGRFVDAASNVRLVEAMEDALAILLVEVQDTVNVDSGELQADANSYIKDFQPGVSVQGAVSMMKDGQQKPYAWQVDRGGDIFPKPENPTGRLWFLDQNGKLIGVKVVHQKGSFYMERSLEATKDKLVETFASAITNAFDVFE